MLLHRRPLRIRDCGCRRIKSENNESSGRIFMIRQFSIGLFSAGALIAACAAPAAAADVQADQAGTLEAVVVTGTRIRAPNLASESPVTAVSDEDIKDQGATNIENVLNEMPQFHVGQSNTSVNHSTGVANRN